MIGDCIKNQTGFITADSCQYVVQGDCISGWHFVFFILALIAMGIFLGYNIQKMGALSTEEKQ